MMGQILKPVANIPLTAPSTPGKLPTIKGCVFNPPVYLDRGKLYLIVVSHRRVYVPEKGFYDVPDKGHLTFIAGFKRIDVSHPNGAGLRCWAFEALEGHPPADWVPKAQGSYTAHEARGIRA